MTLLFLRSIPIPTHKTLMTHDTSLRIAYDIHCDFEHTLANPDLVNRIRTAWSPS